MNRAPIDYEVLFAPHLRNVRPGQNGWVNAWCPFCPDQSRSFGFKRDSGGFRCHQCDRKGSARALAAKLGVDLPHAKHAATQAGVETVYRYFDRDGVFTYEVARRPNHKFFQRRPNGNGGLIWNIEGVERLLYRLPEVLASQGDVWIVEGEKDVDRMFDAGFVATCNSMGGMNWEPYLGKYLRARRCFLIPDNDDKGRRHVADVMRKLRPFTSKVYDVGVLDEARAKGDVSDWFDDGHSVMELLDRANEAVRRAGDDPEAPIDATPDPAYQPSPNGAGAPPGGINGAAPQPPAEGPQYGDMGDILMGGKFAAQHRGRVLWSPSHGWLVWDGRRWAVDQLKVVIDLAKTTVRSVHHDLAEAQTEEEQEVLRKLIATYSKKDRIAGMLAMAEPDLAILADKFDRDPFLFNCRTGTVNLRDGSLKPHNPTDLITMISDVDYDPSAKCARFELFMREVFIERTDLISYLQRAIGYSFTGNQREHAFFFCWGKGKNGKSTLMNILRAAAGDYGHAAPAEMLLTHGLTDRIPTDIADLRGKRFAVAQETDEGRWLAEALLKNITGGDRIVARRMRHDFFEFDPSHHLWLSSNHKPVIRGTDYAIWRRVNLIPFERQFIDKEDDKTLAEVLRGELPGILKWIVQGAMDWFKDGLNPPKIVVAATEQYRTEQDVLGEFINDRCVKDPRAEILFKELYAEYAMWCKDAGLKPWPRQRLGLRLSELGFQQDAPGGKKTRRGLRLKNADDKESNDETGKTFDKFDFDQDK